LILPVTVTSLALFVTPLIATVIGLIVANASC
jgi:hypothetical protein